MLKRYIIILIILILIVIFAVQNVEKVAIKLWMFDVNASLSLIIILTFTIGALVTLLPAFREIRYRRKKISTLEDALKSAKKENGTKDSFSGEINDKQR
jgi:uncharacterized integral membrane protein